MFKRGDFVWGKMRSYPAWPAIVINADDCGKKHSNNNKLWLFWFGDHKFSEVGVEKVTDFKANYLNNSVKSTGKLFKTAVEELLKVLASKHELRFQDTPSLLKWASSGFPCDVPQTFNLKNSKLPHMVEMALSTALNSSVDESDDSDIDPDDILPDVHKGKKSLEEICISCCKRDRKIIAPHPLFIGSVCMQCKKSVSKACKVPSGQLQDLCIICGLGGNLVYCSNNLCLRSFCQLCIEFMVDEKAYEAIKDDDNWLCYLCEVDINKNCLIRRRTTHHAGLSSLPPAPKLKTSISVLALNENGLNILKKVKIKVGKYHINPNCEAGQMCNFLDYSANYKDFSSKEIAEMSADLILGSFFTPALPFDRKMCVKKFFIIFNRFLYRLDATRLHKENVFFIFLAEALVLDENILSRVLRFLMVKPIEIRVGEKKFFVWSNLSYSTSVASKVYKAESLTDENVVEEKIMLPFMKYLQKYFEKDC